MDGEICRLEKDDFLAFVDNLINDFETIGVKEKGGRFVFSHLESAAELRLDHDVTILPPKKFFLPPYEKMIKFNVGEQKGELLGDNTKRVIIGVHPYDIVALKQMDMVYMEGRPDELYKQRRENTIIIGSDILRVNDFSFASSLGTHVVEDGFDLMLTDLGKKVIIEIGSEKGREILMDYARNIKEASDQDIKNVENHRKALPDRYKVKLDVEKDQIPFLLMDVFEHPLWEEESKKCLQCGSCTLVCPTCYCYDIRDEISLTLEDGERIRTWDSCLLPDFTKIASGEIFRKDKSERYRHRFYRKGLYIPMRYNFIACVGCGRCIMACIPKIADPAKVFNTLSRRKHESRGKLVYKMIEGVEADSRILPEPAVIRRIEPLTENEKLFEIELLSRDSFHFEPGQFVEVSVFGVGEAPISISSPPSGDNRFELVIRKVGNLTNRMHSMKEGEKLGIRGPLGKGFRVEDLEGKDLLFVAGGIGIVPLRSLIKHVLSKDNRPRFGKIYILYGARTPKDMLFMDEMEKWKEVDDVEIRLSVDTCPEGMKWNHSVGVVTTLFNEIEIQNPKETVSLVVGPPVMYKFVIKCLEDAGIKDTNIFVSLERRMKCGLGRCGHCQINGIYVCREGPVFRYSDIKNLPEVFQ